MIWLQQTVDADVMETTADAAAIAVDVVLETTASSGSSLSCAAVADAAALETAAVTTPAC